MPLEEPKEWKDCNVYNIAKLFLDENGQKELQQRYEKGGEGHGHFKLYLAELMWEYFRPFREKREYFESHKDEVREILADGAKKAQQISSETMEKIRTKTGISY